MPANDSSSRWVSRAARNAVTAGMPSGALAVFDDHRLAPALGQALGEQPPCDVGAGAGRQRDDQTNGALRPRRGLGEGRFNRERNREHARKRGKAMDRTHHVLPLFGE